MRVLLKLFSQILFSKSHLNYYRKEGTNGLQILVTPGPDTSVFLPFLEQCGGEERREEKREGEREQSKGFLEFLD